MRPGDLYFLLVPPPAGVGAFIAQHEWLTVILVVGAFAVLGVFVRFSNLILGEMKEKTYYAFREEREQFLDRQLDRREGRRMRKLEAEQQRREFKRRRPSWWDQLRLFR